MTTRQQDQVSVRMEMPITGYAIHRKSEDSDDLTFDSTDITNSLKVSEHLSEEPLSMFCKYSHAQNDAWG